MARVGQAVSLAPPTFEVKPCGSNLVAPIALVAVSTTALAS